MQTPSVPPPRSSMIPSIGQGRPSAVRQARPGGLGIAMGCAALLVVLAGIAALVAYFVTGSLEFAGLSSAGSPRAEVRDLRAIRGRGGALILVGELASLSDAPLGAPEAKLTLFDASKAPIGSASCAPPIKLLGPREKVPCAFSFGVVGAYATMDLRASAPPAPTGVEPAKLTVSGVTLSPSGAELAGAVQNAGSFPARRIVLLGALYGAEGKIVGQAQGSLGDLAPGASVSFRVPLADLAAPARSFAVRAFGYRE